MRARAAVALASSLALPAVAAPAQESAPAPAVFRSDVSLVLLPVFVIDKEGRAVRGLAPADFEVQVDGRRAEVVSFRYVDTTDSEDEEERAVASAARRRFLLLFDKSFTDPTGLRRAQQAAADFVRRRLAPSDLASVATFDVQNGIRLVAGFTEDRALLAHAVATLGVPSLTRISDPLGLAADFSVTDLQPARPDEDPTTPQALVDNVALVLVQRMRAAEEQAYIEKVGVLLDGFEGLARALRGVEGRKQVLYFSAGFDARVLVGQWGGEQKAIADSIAEGRLWEVDGRTRFGDSRIRETMSQAARALAAADTVVHSIDVSGLGSDRSLVQAAPSQQSARDTTNRESLGFLPAETGGRLFDNHNELGPALAEMLEMTSRYYVLGVQPEREKAPGAFHKLKVKVARKGAKLSHRPGYFERVPGALQTALQRQFELAELVMTGLGEVEVPFSALCLPFPQPGELQTLGVVVQVPRSSLGWMGPEPVSLEVYAYAVAESGTVRDHLAQFARIDPARADPGGRVHGVSLYGTLAVPPGRHTIRIMVREPSSGKSAVRILDVTVPPYDGRAAFALPPLVLDEADRWLRLDMGAGKAATGPAEAPFRLAEEAFVPRTSFEVRPGSPERLALLVWDPEVEGDPAADVEIRSSLTASDGRLVPPGRLRVERVERTGEGRRAFVFSYAPEEGVAPGDYTLRIGLGESGTYAQAHALLRFR